MDNLRLPLTSPISRNLNLFSGRPCLNKKMIRFAIAILVFLNSNMVCANTPEAVRAPAQSLVAAYPSNTIQSETQAAEALQKTANARREVEWQAYDAQQQCQQNFFVSPCTTEVERAKRDSLRQLQRIEIEAEQTRRQLRGQQQETLRQQKIAEAEHDAQALSQQYQQQRQEFEQKQNAAQRQQTEFNAQSTERAAKAQRENQRRAARAAELKAKEKTQQDQAEQRAQNVLEFEQKQKDALERQERLKKQREEKQREETKKAF